MDIVILLYDRFTALDAIGPYEVLSRMPGARARFVASAPGPVTTDTGSLTVLVDEALDAVPQPEIVLIPGGPGDVTARVDARTIDWLRQAHTTTTWTTSVCTGALILGKAGLLDGRRATTHWLSMDALPTHGAKPVAERVVFDDKIVTAAGVSAGIDMALTLAGRIAGRQVAEAIQLGIEYDPQPPFDTGSPAKAGPELTALLADRRQARLREDAVV